MTVFRLRGDRLNWLKSDNETTAFDEAGWAYFAVNPSGTFLWERLAEGTSHQDLVDGLEAAFNVDRATAAADVDAFLAQLDEAGLLVQE
jgi:hypothetical protein